MLTRSSKFSILAGCFLAAFCLLAADKDKDKDSTPVDPKLLPPVSDQQGVTYAADIQPMFQKSCYPCHSSKSRKVGGKQRLDSLEGVLKGGEDGKAVVPGDSAKSDMVVMVSHLGDPDDYMPPPKNRGHIQPLTKDQIGLIRAWIDQGCK